MLFPKVDQRKDIETTKGIFNEYDMNKTFHPGVGGPYNAYSDNIDKESSLFNRFQPLQRCQQTIYFPNTYSDLYIQMGVQLHTIPTTITNPHKIKGFLL